MRYGYKCRLVGTAYATAKLEFYLKWSLVPLSVIGMKSSESENENMPNSRNLFCMVALDSSQSVKKYHQAYASKSANQIVIIM